MGIKQSKRMSKLNIINYMSNRRLDKPIDLMASRVSRLQHLGQLLPTLPAHIKALRGAQLLGARIAAANLSL